MPTGIDVSERIIPHIGVPVKVTRRRRVRHQRICGDKTPQRRVVEASVIVIQAKALGALPGELEVGGQGTGGVARLAVGIVGPGG